MFQYWKIIISDGGGASHASRASRASRAVHRKSFDTCVADEKSMFRSTHNNYLISKVDN